MNRLREKFQHFMIGRYGMDPLGQFSAYAVLALLLLNVVIRRRLPSLVLEVLTFAGILLMYFRMFSRNINRRYQENQVFLRYKFYAAEYWRKTKFRFTEGRKYRIFKCPDCKQKVRIPKGHGKVSIHCPKCGTDFIRKS
ncbi:MAG: hypothetical protein LIP16_04265 [Clostridium sp.]|nr:hypothetical protein [Clostridium sp.]